MRSKVNDEDRSFTVKMTAVCWPIFEATTHFDRQAKYHTIPTPEEVRHEMLSAFRDAEELARDDPATARAWDEWVRAMMVYFIDYKMLNSDWEGRDFWSNAQMEIDPEVLDHVEALGGDTFFEDCDKVKREYTEAERRDRRDKEELGTMLGLYFTCLRLGFKGKYHSHPQELADYTRRLFSSLPAYTGGRSQEMFPDTYKHNQELRIDYRLGATLSFVLLVFAFIIGGSLIAFRMQWHDATSALSTAAGAVRDNTFFKAESGAGPSGNTPDGK